MLDSLGIGVAAVLLCAAPKVPAPKFLTMPIYMVAGASLFIYLLHFRFLQVVNGALGLPVIVAFGAAIAGGVVVWQLWNWGTKQAGDVWGRVSIHLFKPRPATA